MANPTVHVIPHPNHPPICHFTEETDPKKWPSGHEFINEEEAITYRFVEDFAEMITCSTCRKDFRARWKKLLPQPSLSGSSHIPKNPNWVADIGD